MSLLRELKDRNVVRVAAAYVVVSWLIIQVVETIFPAFGFGDAAVRLAVMVLAIGFLPTLILAWIFELTPQGLKREKDIDRSRVGETSSTRGFDRMVMVTLVVALGYFAVDKFIVSPQDRAAELEQARAKAAAETLQSIENSGPAENSIAVLPFVDMSPAGDHEYFAEGVTEELLNVLAAMPELRVTSRTSAFAFKGQDIEIPDIAQKLNVAHVLEGSVRKYEERVRVTAQLIDTRSDTHLWSETYDRAFEDIFTIQDDIARLVADQLNVTLLGGIPQSPPGNPQAWDLYWKAQDLSAKIVLEDFPKIIQMFQDVLLIDPAFAPAWVALGDFYQRQGLSGQRPEDEALAMARQAIQQGLALDPDYPRGHYMLGWLAMRWVNDLEAAARHYSRVHELQPGSTAGIQLLMLLGRLDEGIQVYEHLIKDDPLNAQTHTYLGSAYQMAGRFEESIASLTMGKLLSPNARHIDYRLGLSYLLSGNANLAASYFERERATDRKKAGLILAFHDLGRTADSDRLLVELAEQDACYSPSIHAYRGEVDQAFDQFEACWKPDCFAGPMQINPLFANLYDDRRWISILDHCGRSPEQTREIKFSITLPGEEVLAAKL